MKDIKIFGGSFSEDLARDLALILNIPLSQREIFIFPDQERRIKLEEEVVDKKVVIVQSTATPADTSYMELFFLADAASRSGASSLVAVVPYMGYQRQDHVFRSGEAVSLQVIVKIFEILGIDRIITFDLHSIKIPEFFHIPVSHLSALPIFADQIKKLGFDSHDSFLVSPDMGGIRRIKQISVMLDNMPFAVIEKNRDLETGFIEVAKVEGDIRKRAFIIDDMISSGKTMVEAAKLLAEKGTEEVYVFATHPIFSSDASNLLQQSIIKKVFVTDSVSIPEYKRFAKLEILSIAGIIAEEIKKLFKYENTQNDSASY